MMWCHWSSFWGVCQAKNSRHIVSEEKSSNSQNIWGLFHSKSQKRVNTWFCHFSQCYDTFPHEVRSSQPLPLMSLVTWDLVTIKQHFVHRAAGLSADANKGQLVSAGRSICTSSQAWPIFCLLSERNGPRITARLGSLFLSAQLGHTSCLVCYCISEPKIKIFGCCHQRLQGKSGTSVAGSRWPRVHLERLRMSTKCHGVMTREKKSRLMATALCGPEQPQPVSDHSQTVGGNRKSAFFSVGCDWQAH